MKIRIIQPSDKAQWQVLWNGYQTFYGHPDRSQDFFDYGFTRLLSDDSADFEGLVADEEGQLLGLAHYVFHPHLWRSGGVCYLQDLFTTPEARGKGVGRALVEAVSEKAEARGAESLYWLTAENNYAGRILYDQLATRTSFIKYQRDFS